MIVQKLGILHPFRIAAVAAAAASLLTAQAGRANSYGEGFSSPDEAARMLVKAAESKNMDSVLKILGPSAKTVLVTSDKVADARARQAFVRKVKEKMVVTGDPKNPGVKLMEIGNDRWPFPIPIVKAGNLWHFDVDRGKREILLRRIGANELSVINISRGYVEAQNEYFDRNPSGMKVPQYAQRVISTPGQRDGLYWRSTEAGDESPIGQFVAKAISEGYTKGEPYHGYRFKILKEQGPHAAGGAMSYMNGDAMTRGFALIAWPSDYRSTGVMTFLVDRSGIVYQKDLGKDTSKIAGAMNSYDPDGTWTPVAGSGVPVTSQKTGRSVSRASR
jgi:hypothetical protein